MTSKLFSQKRLSIPFYLLLNFSALGIGSLLMNEGPVSDWYSRLNKAPWSPPGWVFGFAWTTIMFCFSLYMSRLTRTNRSKKVFVFFAVQWGLNTSWNFIFFNRHWVLLGLLVLLMLTALLGYLMATYKSLLKGHTLLVLPYFLWLLVAISLNAYVLFWNRL
jgi:benzodiazapine receptor